MRILLLSAAAAALMASPAFAQDNTRTGLYGTLGYSQLNGEDNADVGAVTGRVGYRLNRLVGVEAEASTGVSDQAFSVGGVDGSLELDYDAAAYVVGFLPLGERVELFARGGYGTTSLETSVGALSETTDSESWNYGAGVNFNLSDRNALRADWTRRDFKDDAGGEADAYSLNFVRRF